SRLVVVGKPARADEIADRLARVAKEVSIGHPFDDGVFMGPLASEAAVQRFESGLAGARSSRGIEEVLASKRLEPRGLKGCYVTPAVHRVHRVERTPYEREELFGPDVAVYHAGDVDEAISMA